MKYNKNIFESSILLEAFPNASLSTVVDKFMKVLQRRLGKTYYGNPNITDTIIKPSGKYIGIKYEVASGDQAIRFNIKKGNTSNIDQIDFWFKFSARPSLTLNTKGLNLIQLLDTIVDVIEHKKLFKDLVVIEESVNNTNKLLTESKVPFSIKGLINYIKKSTSVYQWLKDKQKDSHVKFLVKAGKWKLIYDAYITWCKDNKEEPYTYQNVRLLILKALKSSKMAVVEEIEVEKSEPEKIIVDDKEGEKEFDALDAFRLTPDELFEQMDTYVKSVATGHDYSLIIAGDPGTGKTYTLEKTLESLGFTKKSIKIEKLDTSKKSKSEDDEYSDTSKDIEGFRKISSIDKKGRSKYDVSNKEEKNTIPNGNTYILIKGSATPASTYEVMYHYKNSLIVFDDCDSLFNSEEGVNLIKGATDSKKVREISWLSTRNASKGLPQQFEFSGRVIFITNKYLKDIDSAIKSRGLIMEVNMKSEEIIDRIKKVMPNLLKDIPEATMQIKEEVLEYVLSISNLYKKLDFRTFEQSVKERLRGSPNWKKLVARSIILKSWND